MDTSNPKSILVDTIKKSSNILVTVAHNPSVDALAAALGFSLMLNKLDKHATAVFSGVVPPAITFLEPEKNFQGTVDSLRDFIIAIDKEKADRLRYKVEGDVVRIYITPYRTNISEKDLQYSQGDFNVDLIIALGVEKQSDLDESITAHGRILHDATVATVNTSNIKSSIGTLGFKCVHARSNFITLLGGATDSEVTLGQQAGDVFHTSDRGEDALDDPDHDADAKGRQGQYQGDLHEHAGVSISLTFVQFTGDLVGDLERDAIDVVDETCAVVKELFGTHAGGLGAGIALDGGACIRREVA